MVHREGIFCIKSSCTSPNVLLKKRRYLNASSRDKRWPIFPAIHLAQYLCAFQMIIYKVNFVAFTTESDFSFKQHFVTLRCIFIHLHLQSFFAGGQCIFNLSTQQCAKIPITTRTKKKVKRMSLNDAKCWYEVKLTSLTVVKYISLKRWKNRSVWLPDWDRRAIFTRAKPCNSICIHCTQIYKRESATLLNTPKKKKRFTKINYMQRKIIMHLVLISTRIHGPSVLGWFSIFCGLVFKLCG